MTLASGGGARVPATVTADIGAEAQRRLVEALRGCLAAVHGVRETKAIETHISYVLIAGDAAYKVKKVLRLPFVDYSTLALRRHFCDEELRLNRRLAPALYRDVVAITGSVEHPSLDAAAPVLDYAVRMRAFAHDALMATRLEQGTLPGERIDELAAIVASFHRRIVPAPPDSPFGEPRRVLADALDNFDAIAPLADAAWREPLARLRRWTLDAFARCETAIAQRKRDGFVRECHGDLHLGNAALVDGRVTVFDCIEFNAHLRWIDVISEAAFVVMDLADRKRHDYAWRFLNAYLESTGDYGGVAVLRFHLVYRAMVRAKVRFLRAAQLGEGTERASARREAERYLDLALRLADAVDPALIITHGPAGCGKTTFSQRFVESLGAIRLRTDVERKRLHGLAATSETGSAVDAGLYAPGETERTYAHLASMAAPIVEAGYTALLDGTFLLASQRDRMRRLAQQLGAAFVILDVQAPEATLRARVAARRARGGDASEATLDVLDRQLRRREPLDAAERRQAIAIDGTLAPSDPRLGAANAALEQARRAGPDWADHCDAVPAPPGPCTG